MPQKQTTVPFLTGMYSPVTADDAIVTIMANKYYYKFMLALYYN